MENLLKELAQLLMKERELIVSESFKDYPTLVEKKDGLIQELNQGLSFFTSQAEREERREIEVTLRELLEINRENMFLLHSYRLYQKKIVRILGLEENQGEETSYREGLAQAARSLLDAKA